MHRFNVTIRGRKLVATDITKQDFLERLLDDYEHRNLTVQVSFEIPQKDINQEQERLYRAFILQAAEHFGTDFADMQRTLKNLLPEDFHGDPIHVSKWNTEQLNTFISRASSYLAQYGFNF